MARLTVDEIEEVRSDYSVWISNFENGPGLPADLTAVQMSAMFTEVDRLLEIHEQAIVGALNGINGNVAAWALGPGAEASRKLVAMVEDRRRKKGVGF